MSNRSWLSDAQMQRLRPLFPKSIQRSENRLGDCFPEGWVFPVVMTGAF